MPRRTTTRVLSLLFTVIGALALTQPVTAGGGQANIEAGLPLTFEDTVPQDYLGREFQLVTRYERTDDGEDSWHIEPRLELGILPNTQLTIAAPFLFGDAYEHDGLGPVELDLLYNINQETLDLPAVAVKVGVDFTNAARAGGGDGIDPFFGILIDRTIGDSSLYQKVHLNLTYQVNAEQRDEERSGRYEVAIGYSRRIGASAMLLANLVREQEMEDNVEVNLAEIGIRYGLTPQSVVSFGIGFGIGDESPDARITFGYQFEF